MTANGFSSPPASIQPQSPGEVRACSRPADAGTPRRRWPFFSTPLGVFSAVMGPISAMMLLLASLPAVPVGIRISAAAVVLVSVVSLLRGYGRRVELSEMGIRFRRPGGGDWFIPWGEVRLVGRYVPLDRNRTCRYVFVTRLEDPPVDRRELDADTIQLQDRPGLLEAIEWYRRRAGTPRTGRPEAGPLADGAEGH
ncbi:MAG: hypothetical protein AMXMBFR83_01330 [Phycisphaerae bacterium]